MKYVKVVCKYLCKAVSIACKCVSYCCELCAKGADALASKCEE